MTFPSTSRRPPPDTARQRLRDGLALLHETLDDGVSTTCLHPRPDLARLLALHAAALPPLVAGLEAAGAAGLWPGWDEPARLAALRADLRALGIAAPGACRPAAIPFSPGPQAWGGLYALLGSRLGSRVVLRRFAEAGQPAPGAFLRFGTEDRTAWPRFLEAFEAATAPADLDGALEGGRRVMQHYLDVLPARPDHDPISGPSRPDAAFPA